MNELSKREKKLLIFATFLMKAVTDIPDNQEIRGTVTQMHLEWAQAEWKHIGPTLPKDMRKRMGTLLANYKKAVKRNLT